MKEELGYWTIKLLAKFKFINLYTLGDVKNRILYEAHGFKHADKLFAEFYADVERIGPDEASVKYKDLLAVNEPESARANILIERKQFLQRNRTAPGPE